MVLCQSWEGQHGDSDLAFIQDQQKYQWLRSAVRAVTCFGAFPHPQGSEGVAHLERILHIFDCTGDRGFFEQEQVCSAAPFPTSAVVSGSRQGEKCSCKLLTEEFPNLRCLCKYNDKIGKSTQSEGAGAGQVGCSAADTPCPHLWGLFLQNPEAK